MDDQFRMSNSSRLVQHSEEPVEFFVGFSQSCLVSPILNGPDAVPRYLRARIENPDICALSLRLFRASRIRGWIQNIDHVT
jgi:hypothetical protein